MIDRNQRRLPLTAAVLAGGRSERMGVDKTLLDIRGQALVARVAERVREVCAHTLVATNRPDALTDVGLPADVRVLRDEVAYQGPLGGLVTALAAATDEWMLAVGADMPHVTPEIIRALWDLRGDADAVVPVTEKGTEPLLALYRVAACLPAARDVLASGGRRIVGVFARVKTVEVPEELLRTVDPELRFLVNVNTPADLRDARERVLAEPHAIEPLASSGGRPPRPETISVEQALELVLGFVKPLPRERVSLLDALNRVLAEDAASDIDLPPFDTCAADGVAVRAGGVVLRAGEVIGPTAIGLLASAGHDTVTLYARPRVGVLTTGSELIEAEEKPGPGKIRNSNSYSVAAQVLAAGAIPVRYGIVPDDRDATRAAFDLAASECDLVITSGGSSSGDFDFVQAVLEEMGQLTFSKVEMRPGNPQMIGNIHGVPFFGLPGNPTSAYASFEVSVRPALRAMQGFSTIARPVTRARLSHAVTKRRGRRFFEFGLVERDPVHGGYHATLSGTRSSAMPKGARGGWNCLVILPESNGIFPAGAEVDCVRLDMEEGTP